MNKERIARIDNNKEVKELLLPHCRLKYGEIWEDSICGHKVGCLDATKENDIMRLMGNNKATLAIQDPPYNVIVGNSNTGSLSKTSLEDYIEWSKQWVQNTVRILRSDAHFYIWCIVSDPFRPKQKFFCHNF